MSEAMARRWFTPARLLRISLWVTGLMWVLPFLVPGKLPPVPSFHAEMVAAVLGLVAMSALLAFVGRLELPRVALLPLGLAGLIVIQLLLGLLAYRQVGLLASLYLLWAVGLVILGGLFRRELGIERVASMLSWFLLAGALASALIGWAQHIDSDALERVMMPRAPLRVWANLGQSNHLADYLALGLIAVAYLYTTGRLRLRWVVPATLALTYILGLTGSRASGLYLAMLIALSAAFWTFDRSAANRRLLAYCSWALVALVVLPWLVDLAPTTAEPGDSVYERPFEERPRIWKAALLMFLDSPLLGIGFRQFGWHHFALNAQMPEPRMLGFTDHAHNLLLHVLAEFGHRCLENALPGAVGVALPLLGWGCGFTDLDNDGDLDVIVNNLNEVAGIYRNESSAPRVGVRLKGQAGNTQGIGAKIKILGGAVPMQSQEVICGGRYLSGDDPMRVFAAGSLTNQMRIEVAWRSGKRSVVAGVQANRIYEIEEAGARR
jgi:O-antigen ligase